ncbi:MAG: tRNA (N(6)-L-threonylcarbamoyladenosine(37)-C(2))-methylthiotransferase MtaB [Evtepia sp.]
MRIAIHTLGCKVNQYETQAMERILTERGHILVECEHMADAVIINTCAVTASGDRKSRQAVRQARRSSPDAIIAVCGCYAQIAPKEVGELDVDLICGTGERVHFLDLLERVCQTRDRMTAVTDVKAHRNFELLPAGGLEGRTRAMLKVEDGCTNFCAYCVIPYARGAVRSLAPIDVALELYRLSEQGYMEIVLTGIEISSWGRDLPGGQSLTDLVEMVCKWDYNGRIRLGSLEPRTITEDFCQRLSVYSNLCPHFHLSLQSGCDATLARMNRKYDTARYLESVILLRRWFPKAAITTDLIVGFPGETEEEFEETLAFIRRCNFASMHIFPYSKRPGTPAATFSNQLSNHEKSERAKRASIVAKEMTKTWLNGFLGQKEEVLFEEERDGYWRGHTKQFVPVSVHGENLHNRFAEVEVTAVTQNECYGTIVQGE